MPEDHDDGIPVIDASMLNPEVEFERGMSHWPIASILIIGACTLIFLIQVSAGGLENADRMVAMGAKDVAEIRDGAVWRLVSANFMHGSPDHLIGNLVLLYVLGMACEHGLGRLQFLILYIFAGIAGTTLSLLSPNPSLGASGAIFGPAGAVIVVFWRHQHELKMRDRRIGFVLLMWALYQLVLGSVTPGIDNLAHLGGLLSGAALGLVLQPVLLNEPDAINKHPLVIVAFCSSIIVLLGSALFFVPRLWNAL